MPIGAEILMGWLWATTFAALVSGLEPPNVQKALEDLVRPGTQGRADFHVLQQELEAAHFHGYLALLYFFGIADSSGKLEFPTGFPRDVRKGREHLAKAVSKRRISTQDPWTFTLLGFLLSIESPYVAQIELKVLEGPEVVIKNPESILNDNNPRKDRQRQGLSMLDRVGAAFWEAAERKELIGSIVFASMVRRGLTDVPLSWQVRKENEPLLGRSPDLLIPKRALASERACRALGVLIGPATEASKNEEPLLDKQALNWKVWRHRQQRPSDDDWQTTKEYVDAIKHGADVMKEASSMRELAAVHFQGHTEAEVQPNKTLAESYWSKAAKEGDLWSAWHATLSYIRDGNMDEAVPYLDIVSNSSLMPLKFMALHFKYRLGIGEVKDPKMAGNFLKASADLGNSNAQLLLAHSYMGFKQGNMEGVEPPGGPNKAAALTYYKAAAANGRLVPKLNAGLLIAQGADFSVTDRDLQCAIAYKELAEVIYAAYPPAHLLFAHARRAFVLGDVEGSRLRFALLSDAGFILGHLNAAWLWDQDSIPQVPFWDRYRFHPMSKEAFLYYRRAAVSGHTPSMTELSLRLRRHAESMKLVSKELHSQQGSYETLMQSSYRWTALAAELGEARAIFDQAYMLQFGLGIKKNKVLAQKLYNQLAKGDTHSWPARIAALSWLGLNSARDYFLGLREAVAPLLDSLRGSFAAAARSSLENTGFSQQEHSANKQPLRNACVFAKGAEGFLL
ncbi:unnamed protein product [Durusdinium trenchii]|uniref:Uncharacterized protein n=2 Tax=Durusdinium trenchii TaxID=1381693 RepID=A0ABP0KCD4_9DINO